MQASESSVEVMEDLAKVRTLVSSVLPTPVGPAKSMAAMGRRGSFRPVLARFIALDTALTASAWPMTRSCKVAQ